MSLDKIEAREGKAEMPWWWSTDQERYYGPCTSRADAILSAWADHPDTPSFHVMQATHSNVNTDILTGDDLAERFDDANEDNSDPDGDAMSASLPGAEWEALADRFGRQIEAALRKHGVVSWRFAQQTAGEWVSIATPMIAALPAAAIEVIAEIASTYAEDPKLPPDFIKRRIGRLEVVLEAAAKSTERDQ